MFRQAQVDRSTVLHCDLALGATAPEEQLQASQHRRSIRMPSFSPGFQLLFYSQRLQQQLELVVPSKPYIEGD